MEISDVIFERFWARVQERKQAEISTLHILKDKDGYNCLDLSIASNSLVSIKKLLEDTWNTSEFSPAPREFWEKLWKSNPYPHLPQGTRYADERYKWSIADRIFDVVVINDRTN